MTAAFVAGTVNGANSSTTDTTLGVAYAGAVTSGNLLVCKAQCDLDTTITVADTVNGAWTPIGTGQFLSGAGKVQLFYKQNTAAGTPTVTMTTTAGTGYKNIIVAEYSGIEAVAIDTGTGNSATGTSTTPAVTVTTVTDHDLVIAAAASAGTITAGNGNVRRIQDGNALEDFLDKTPAGDQSCTFTQVSAAWAAVGAGFLAVAAAPPQTVRPDADTVTTGWSTAPLFSKINDTDDATFITATLA